MPPEAPLELNVTMPFFFQIFLLTWRNATSSILVYWIIKMSGWWREIRSSIGSSLPLLPSPLQLQEISFITYFWRSWACLCWRVFLGFFNNFSRVSWDPCSLSLYVACYCTSFLDFLPFVLAILGVVISISPSSSSSSSDSGSSSDFPRLSPFFVPAVPSSLSFAWSERTASGSLLYS